METIFKILEAVKNSNNIVILSHVGPDGDTLGSMFAMKQIIEQFDHIKKIDTVIISRKPEIYNFLPGIDFVKFAGSEELYSTYDLAIALDVADIERLAEARELFKNARKTINIDHHVTNNAYGDINYIIHEAAATGEIIYSLIEPFKVNLTQDIAINLYTAILTDTGGFKFENTTPNVFEIAAKLIEYGANPKEIYKNCYENKPLEMVKIQAWAVANSVFVENNQIAYSLITRKDLKDFNASDDYLDGISETLRQVNTVKVAMVLKETTKGDTKISFRSNSFDVGNIAGFFGGGGHKLAAGCIIHKNLNESLNEILPLIQKELKKESHKAY
ncbi:MAG: bifunctional oligoribonuclease/PAP phosphatase NrnA [Candidatus Gastranaerophilales bacterium]|nr:bifunctional oligoribonuclease/PAP phosphatase NrnA [Candidatus Gastranaerophilales bacterium]